MTGQIGLPLDWSRPDAEFLVSEANALAVRHLDHRATWPVRTSILIGPPRSGRTTLARRFARDTGGSFIDDVEGQADDILFHAWNHAQESGEPLLLVATRPPEQWDVTLPDLRSRLAASPVVALAEPDDGLALALIERGLEQAGSAYSRDLPAFLHARIERSYAAIAAALAALNDASLSSNRKISVAFAKEILGTAGILPQ